MSLYFNLQSDHLAILAFYVLLMGVSEHVVRVIMQQILVVSDETSFVHKFIQRLAPYDIEV